MSEERREPIGLLIVDDDPLVRAGLTLMLGGASDVRILGECADGSEVLGAVARLRPAVVLMDIRMPTDGLGVTEQLRALPDAPEVIVLTTFAADENVVRALRAGAAGFLLKDTPPERIAGAIRQVGSGYPVLSAGVLSTLLRRSGDSEEGPDARRHRATARLDPLNDREREVAVAVGRCLSNADIGAELHLSLPTVKTYVSSILTKLDLNNRVQIALLVHDAGLVDDESLPY